MSTGDIDARFLARDNELNFDLQKRFRSSQLPKRKPTVGGGRTFSRISSIPESESFASVNSRAVSPQAAFKPRTSSFKTTSPIKSTIPQSRPRPGTRISVVPRRPGPSSFLSPQDSEFSFDTRSASRSSSLGEAARRDAERLRMAELDEREKELARREAELARREKERLAGAAEVENAVRAARQAEARQAETRRHKEAARMEEAVRKEEARRQREAEAREEEARRQREEETRRQREEETRRQREARRQALENAKNEAARKQQEALEAARKAKDAARRAKEAARMQQERIERAERAEIARNAEIEAEKQVKAAKAQAEKDAEREARRAKRKERRRLQEEAEQRAIKMAEKRAIQRESMYSSRNSFHENRLLKEINRHEMNAPASQKPPRPKSAAGSVYGKEDFVSSVPSASPVRGSSTSPVHRASNEFKRRSAIQARYEARQAAELRARAETEIARVAEMKEQKPDSKSSSVLSRKRKSQVGFVTPKVTSPKTKAIKPKESLSRSGSTVSKKERRKSKRVEADELRRQFEEANAQLIPAVVPSISNYSEASVREAKPDKKQKKEQLKKEKEMQQKEKKESEKKEKEKKVKEKKEKHHKMGKRHSKNPFEVKEEPVEMVTNSQVFEDDWEDIDEEEEEKEEEEEADIIVSSAAAAPTAVDQPIVARKKSIKKFLNVFKKAEKAPAVPALSQEDKERIAADAELVAPAAAPVAPVAPVASAAPAAPAVVVVPSANAEATVETRERSKSIKFNKPLSGFFKKSTKPNKPEDEFEFENMFSGLDDLEACESAFDDSPGFSAQFETKFDAEFTAFDKASSRKSSSKASPVSARQEPSEYTFEDFKRESLLLEQQNSKQQKKSSQQKIGSVNKKVAGLATPETPFEFNIEGFDYLQGIIEVTSQDAASLPSLESSKSEFTSDEEPEQFAKQTRNESPITVYSTPNSSKSALKSAMKKGVSPSSSQSCQSNGVSFSNRVHVSKTWSKTIYDRQSDETNTCSYLTPSLIEDIKVELNHFKKSMSVHRDSYQNTHYFVI